MQQLAQWPSTHPDQLVSLDNWSDLSQITRPPEIHFERMHRYRLGRIVEQMQQAGVAVLLLVSPVSLRYACEYRSYGLFQSHIPTTYLLVTATGHTYLYNGYGEGARVDDTLSGPPIGFFDGGDQLPDQANKLADILKRTLSDMSGDPRRVALEYVNPSITQALERAGLEVVDGVNLVETARLIKSEDEIACIRWSIAVAEHGATRLKAAMQPGVSENQLWGLLNYTNLANDGDWHEGRMLASGPRINPWLQEASSRRLEAGDLVGFDTDMVGPYGYCADLSRTFFCGPGQPSRRQRELYRLACDEIDHNLTLVRPGMSLTEFQKQAYPVDEAFHANAYTCVLHGIGMCDEYPRVNPIFRGPNPYEGVIQEGMVLCIESYMGAVGERDGIKLEEQVLVTATGYERLTQFPREAVLLD